MSVFDHDGHGSDRAETGRRRLIAALLAAGVAVVVAVVTLSWIRSAHEPAGTTVEHPAEAPSATGPAPAPKETAPATPEPSVPRARTARPGRPEPAAPETAAAPAPALVLHVESDVPGASVFVDRKYLGVTPLATSDVTPGSHQLNVSAEGHEGIARTIDVAATGSTSVTVRFNEVTLDAAVAVVHKHAMGSCDGRLVADVQGLRYETTNKGDAFRIGFADLETFEVDYMQKNLRVKRRGGRTWNFTDPSGNADALFVFHRDVSKARAKLAGQGGQ